VGLDGYRPVPHAPYLHGLPVEFVMESLEILSLAVSAVLLHRGVLVGVVCAEIFKREVIPQCTQGVVLVHE